MPLLRFSPESWLKQCAKTSEQGVDESDEVDEVDEAVRLWPLD